MRQGWLQVRLRVAEMQRDIFDEMVRQPRLTPLPMHTARPGRDHAHAGLTELALERACFNCDLKWILNTILIELG